MKKFNWFGRVSRLVFGILVFGVLVFAIVKVKHHYYDTYKKSTNLSDNCILK